MSNEDNFDTPSEGSPTWVAELRRRCPTPEETDALCDKADRLADIERSLRELIAEQRVVTTNELRAILDPPE